MHSDSDIELIRALAEFRYTLRGFLAASEAVSKSAGLMPLHYQAMLVICAWPGPIAMRELAEQLLMTHSAAVQLFDRLVAGGLARREASPDDGRVVLLRLTEKGNDLLLSLAGRHLREMQSRERDLSRSLRRLTAIKAPGEP